MVLLNSEHAFIACFSLLDFLFFDCYNVITSRVELSMYLIYIDDIQKSYHTISKITLNEEGHF